MVINWYGEGCFKIQSGALTLLVDQFDSSLGITPPRFKADIVIKTQTENPPPYNQHGGTSQIWGAGEYEIKGTEIYGYSDQNDVEHLKTIYLVKLEDLKLGFLGHLASMPKPQIFEKLQGAEILFIPAGGSPFIKQADAAKIINQIKPKIAVASFFKISGLKRKAGDIKEFLNEFDGEDLIREEKLSLKRKDLPLKTRIAILQT